MNFFVFAESLFFEVDQSIRLHILQLTLIINFITQSTKLWVINHGLAVIIG